MNKQELAAMVAQILSTMDEPPMVKATEYHATAPQPEAKDTGYTDGDFVPDVTKLDLRKLYYCKNSAINDRSGEMFFAEGLKTLHITAILFQQLQCKMFHLHILST